MYRSQNIEISNQVPQIHGDESSRSYHQNNKQGQQKIEKQQWDFELVLGFS